MKHKQKILTFKVIIVYHGWVLPVPAADIMLLALS